MQGGGLHSQFNEAFGFSDRLQSTLSFSVSRGQALILVLLLSFVLWAVIGGYRPPGYGRVVVTWANCQRWRG